MFIPKPLEDTLIHFITSNSYGFFGNKMPTKTPISLYGVLPALSSIHNLTKLVKIVAPSLMNNMTGLEQSDDGGKILFDIDEAA